MMADRENRRTSGFPALCNLVAQVREGGFLQQAALFLAELAGARRCAIFLVSNSGQGLYPAADATPGDSFSGPRYMTVPVALSGAAPCPLAQVAATQRVLHLEQGGAGYDGSQLREALGLNRIEDCMLLPLHRGDGALMGVVYLAGSPGTGPVGELELRLSLRALAALLETRLAAEAETATRRQLSASLQFSDKERHRLSQQAEEVLARDLPGRSRPMQALRRDLRRLACKDAPVLLLAAPGRLTETLATQLHGLSLRRNGQYRFVSASRLTADRFELELFGHKRGAMPNVAAARRGLLSEAAHGTVFIEGIEALNHDAQRQLARLLDQGQFRPFGSSRDHQLQARMVLSCGLGAIDRLVPELETQIRREVLSLPELGESLSDTADIVAAELARAGSGETWPQVTERDPGLPLWLERLAAGQDRQVFSDRVHQAVLLAQETHVPLKRGHFRQAFWRIKGTGSGNGLAPDFDLSDAVSEFEGNLIRRALETSGGNRARAAQMLNLPKRTLADKCKKYDLA